MTNIWRAITQQLINNPLQKIQIIYGPRQVGKTTLAQTVLSTRNKKTLQVHGEKLSDLVYFQYEDFQKLSAYISWYEVIFVDEAQKIPNIWLILKLIYDHFPEKQLLVTGSSSLDLATWIAEPLTWRKLVYHLYPISFGELQATMSLADLDAYHRTALVYGSYPAIVMQESMQTKKQLLDELVNAYLFKDVLAIEDIKYAHTLIAITRLLAFQLWQEVSLHEISRQVGVSVDTVKKYVHLLEQCFIIFSLSGRSKNLRKEVSKMKKYYFYDLGIRNALIANYNDFSLRNDTWALRENFLLIERKKYTTYTQIHHNSYFWRTYTWAELDYIEENNWTLYTYEFKYTAKKSKVPTTFSETYPNHTFNEISTTNYLQRLTSTNT